MALLKAANANKEM